MNRSSAAYVPMRRVREDDDDDDLKPVVKHFKREPDVDVDTEDLQIYGDVVVNIKPENRTLVTEGLPNTMDLFIQCILNQDDHEKCHK